MTNQTKEREREKTYQRQQELESKPQIPCMGTGTFIGSDHAEFEDDLETSAIVLTGSARAFSAGFDPS